MADPTRWVQVASCGLLSEAQAVATVLEAEGIETRVEDHDRSGISRFATWMVAFPQIVLVREPEEARAREVLETVASTSEAELEAQALAAREEPPEPSPGEAPPARVDPLRVLILLVMVLAVLAFVGALVG